MRNSQPLLSEDGIDKMRAAIEFGLYAYGMGWQYEELRTVWQDAERLGFDVAWLQDNVVGPVPTPPETSIFDCWTVLPALAEATTTIRFGPLVSPCRRRHPAVLAKMASVLDRISDGRLMVGLGISDEAQQFEGWGMGFPPAAERIAILREEIEVIRRLWTDRRANFEGKYYQLHDAINEPKPVQKPHPPLWIGVIYGRQVMPRLAAEYANGIVFHVGDDALCKEALISMRQHCEEFGRDFDEITRARTVYITLTDGTVDLDGLISSFGIADVRKKAAARDFLEKGECNVIGTPEECAEALQRRVIDLGFNHVVVSVSSLGLSNLDGAPLEGDAGNFLGALRCFAGEVMPLLRSGRLTTEQVQEPVPKPLTE